MLVVSLRSEVSEKTEFRTSHHFHVDGQYFAALHGREVLAA